MVIYKKLNERAVSKESWCRYFFISNFYLERKDVFINLTTFLSQTL